MKCITHEQGAHRSKPFILKRATEICMQVGFVETSYQLYINKGQWNKLFGLKKRFFSPKKNSVMIAWRHENDKLEVAPYIHRDGDILILQSVVLDPKILNYFAIKQEGIYINSKFYDYPLWFKKGWYINSWFGGVIPAPKDIRFIFHVR